ncbi:hypothetical protein D3C78_1131140 [compost metagenome]
MLGSIVEETGIGAKGLLHDFFERQVRKTCFRRQLVAVVDICLVVLVVMELERLARHVGCKRVVVVGEFRKFKGHGFYSFLQRVTAPRNRVSGP